MGSIGIQAGMPDHHITESAHLRRSLEYLDRWHLRHFFKKPSWNGGDEIRSGGTAYRCFVVGNLYGNLPLVALRCQVFVRGDLEGLSGCSP
jgi:hypothetical protein